MAPISFRPLFASPARSHMLASAVRLALTSTA